MSAEDLERVFVSLVDFSWKKYNETVHNTHIDELLVGAVIASTVENGYSLIDLNSDGVNHYLRFEHLPTKQRLIFQLTNLSEDIVAAKVLGRCVERKRIVVDNANLPEARSQPLLVPRFLGEEDNAFSLGPCIRIAAMIVVELGERHAREHLGREAGDLRR